MEEALDAFRADPQIYLGRPSDLAGRSEREVRTYDLLDQLGVAYWRVDHTHADTMQECAVIDAILGCSMCKNLFLRNRQGTAYYLLMMPGDKAFHTKDLSHQLGVARLSFAEDEKMTESLDVLPGSVTVLGLMNDSACAVRLLVDREVFDGDFVGCHPCINTSSLRISHHDLFDVFLPAVHHEYTVIDLPREE